MKTYLIAGTSAAGMGAVTKLRQLDKDARIICVSDEKEFPYNKCFLVDYLSHEKYWTITSKIFQDLYDSRSGANKTRTEPYSHLCVE